MKKTKWTRLLGWCLALVMAISVMPSVFADNEISEPEDVNPYADFTSREQVDQMVADFIASHEGELTEQDLADLEEGRIRYGDIVEQMNPPADIAMMSKVEEDPNTEEYQKRYPKDPAVYATGELKTQTKIYGYVKKDGRTYDDTTYWYGYASLYKVEGETKTLVEKQDTGYTGAFSFEISDETGPGSYQIVLTDEIILLPRTVDFYVHQTRFYHELEIATYDYPINIFNGDLKLKDGKFDLAEGAQDGVITQEDYSAYSKYIGANGITPGSELAPLDIDGNGVINIWDAVAVSNRMNMASSDYSEWWIGTGELVSVQDPAEHIKIELGSTEEDLMAALPQEFDATFDNYSPLVRTLPVEFWLGEYDLNKRDTYTLLAVLSVGYEVTGNGLSNIMHYKNNHYVPAIVTIDVVEPPTEAICEAQIVCGKEFAMGLAEDGTVYGEGRVVRKGATTVLAANVAAEWNALPKEEKVIQIYASDKDIVGLTMDGRVKAAGNLALTGTNKETVESWQNIVEVSLSNTIIAGRTANGKLVGVSDQKSPSIVTNGSKVVKVITEDWQDNNVIKFAVGDNHAVAISGTFIGGYSANYNQGASVQPPEVNISSWVAEKAVMRDVLAGPNYTVGVTQGDDIIQITGQFSNGTLLEMPRNLSKVPVDKIRAYGRFIFALRNENFYFIDTEINQNEEGEDYYPDDDNLYYFCGTGKDDNGNRTAWTGLKDIAYSGSFLLGLTEHEIKAVGVFPGTMNKDNIKEWVLFIPEG